MSRAITYHFVEGERGIVSQRIDRTRTPIGANCSAGSQVIFSRRECTRRMVKLMFSNRATVFDQAPIVLLAAECTAHWHLASAKHDEIAGLSVELGFQVAARGRTRELDASLDAHRGTPLSTLACRCVTSASLSVEKQTRSGKPLIVFALPACSTWFSLGDGRTMGPVRGPQRTQLLLELHLLQQRVGEQLAKSNILALQLLECADLLPRREGGKAACVDF